MRRQPTLQYHAEEQEMQRTSQFYTVGAAILFAFGSLMSHIGQICLNVGEYWAGRRTVRAWIASINHFQGAVPGQSQSERPWERNLLRFGSSIVLAIIGSLVFLWLFLSVGGVLAWLAVRGYGAFLLLGAVSVGTIVGVGLARQGHKPSEHDRLN